jgi:hypothetical protein
VLARALAKGVVVMGLAHWSGASTRQALALSITLTPLSAAALVMLGELWLALPALAAQVAPVLLTALVVLELLGPIAVQQAFKLAGELPADGREAR